MAHPLYYRFLGIDVCQATKPALIQNRFSIKTGFASSIEVAKLDLAQNGSIQNMFSTNTKIEASIRATKSKP